MKIIKNEKRINRNGRIGRWSILAALIILGTGMYLSVTNNTDPQMFTFSAVALIVGFVLMQIGIYMGNRYGRSPRPDEKLDTGFKGLNHDFVLYHYSTPVSHLLLGPAGVWVLLPYHQRGQATFKKNRWKMSGGGFAQAYMRIFGQEGLGRPDLEASSEITVLKKYLAKHIDQAEIPQINALMVFTSDDVEIDGEDATIPALKVKQIKEFIRKRVKDKTITPNVLSKIKSLFGEE
ncbi:MAG TPA: hypothetical protein VNA23_00305 [Anaerolineales bacterium]|nr:hypothetical protein [Anaerolineales bacterium]